MNAVLATLSQSGKTTETKAVIVAALWAGAARFVPGVPLMLPEMDLTSLGLGTLTLSPAVLVLIALVQVVKKVVTDNQFPFMPTLMTTTQTATVSVTTTEPVATKKEGE